MLGLTLASLSLLGAVLAQSTDPLFIGCYNPGSTSFGTTLSGYAKQATGMSQAQCDTFCSTPGTTASTMAYPFSFFVPSSAGTASNKCYCTDASGYPPLEGTTTTTGRSGSTTTASDNLVSSYYCDYYDGYATAHDLSTTFTFDNCYSTASGLPTTPSATGNNPDTCFTACRYDQTLVATVTNNIFTCYCGVSSTAFTLSNAGTSLNNNCPAAGSSGYYHWKHSQPNSSLGNKRREMRARQQAALNAPICPVGTTACVIPGHGAESYECIDTSSELESCGGCMSGMVSKDMKVFNETMGVDCSRLPGVALGGVTCSQGQCEVSACKRGRSLVDGQCL